MGAGDKPELLYPEARSELRQMGYETSLEYVAAAAAAVIRETGLLPHINAGTMNLAEVSSPPWSSRLSDSCAALVAAFGASLLSVIVSGTYTRIPLLFLRYKLCGACQQVKGSCWKLPPGD